MYPETTVGALIFNKKGEILLITGKKFKGYFVIPGGHIEYGETIYDAIKREVREETGLIINDFSLFSIQEAIYPEAYIQKKHFIYLDFVCAADNEDIVLNHEADSYLWLKPENLEEIKIEKYTRGLINAWLKENQKTEIVFLPKV